MQEETPPNALLLLVSGDGIPLLVRSYGDVVTPPNAAVGVASALYHAAMREKDASGGSVDLQLLALETKHRSVVYEMTPIDLLLVFASDKPCDGCPSSGVIVRRMLRTVFHALLLLLGQRNLRDWDASKLRAAFAQQVEVIDTIVTQFQIDPRFIFGRPVRDVVAYRQLDGIDIGKSGSLMQGAWFENGQLVGECVGRRECNYTHYIGRAHLARTQIDVKVVIRNSSKGPLISFIGIFGDKVEDDNTLKEMANKLLLCRSKARARETGSPLDGLPNTLICSYASRLGDTPSPSCRTLAYINPSWKTVLKTEATRLKLSMDTKNVSKDWWCRELCRFAAHRQHVTIKMSLNYKQEDEVLTFLQHVRGPVQFVSLCVGPVPVTKVVAIGNALTTAMLYINDKTQ